MANNIVKSNKERYTLNILICSSGEYSTNIDLIPENILIVRYTNTMGNLVNSGYIEYLDTDSRIDRFLQSQYVYCNIDFSKLKLDADGDIKDETTPESAKISFFVDSIGIKESYPGKMLYVINILSRNNFEVCRSFEYSNYLQDGEPITNIIKRAFTDNKLTVDEDSFAKHTSSVKLKYITCGNDSILTSITYLLNKLYYYKKYGIDDSIKSLVYDEFHNVYHLFDMNIPCQYQKTHPVEIKMIAVDSDILNELRVNVAFLTTRSKTESIKTTIQSKIYEYDYDNNVFKDTKVTSNNIVSYYGGEKKNNKLQPILDNTFYKKNHTLWNNDINFYKEQFDNLTKNLSMIVNIFGKINILPGWFIPVTVSIDDAIITSKNSSLFNKSKKMYQSMSGTWTVYSVEHFIVPTQNVFRLNLTLMRCERTIE